MVMVNVNTITSAFSFYSFCKVVRGEMFYHSVTNLPLLTRSIG